MKFQWKQIALHMSDLSSLGFCCGLLGMCSLKTLNQRCVSHEVSDSHSQAFGPDLKLDFVFGSAGKPAYKVGFFHLLSHDFV